MSSNVSAPTNAAAAAAAPAVSVAVAVAAAAAVANQCRWQQLTTLCAETALCAKKYSTSFCFLVIDNVNSLTQRNQKWDAVWVYAKVLEYFFCAEWCCGRCKCGSR